MRAHRGWLIVHTSAAYPVTWLCREQYEYVMVADDDLIMDACVINTVFEVRHRGLL